MQNLVVHVLAINRPFSLYMVSKSVFGALYSVKRVLFILSSVLYTLSVLVQLGSNFVVSDEWQGQLRRMHCLLDQLSPQKGAAHQRPDRAEFHQAPQPTPFGHN